MIGSLKGILSHKGIGSIIVDVQGVGYQVFIPISSFYHLPDLGSPISLVIHTHVREGEISLYGFLNSYEKDLFLLLLMVNGIGPKMALNILSHKSVQDLIDGICGGKVADLQAIPGVGRKMAERLVIELKEKVRGLDLEQILEIQPLDSGQRKVQDVLEALMQLGYKRGEAEKMIKAPGLDQSASVEEMLKAVLKVG